MALKKGDKAPAFALYDDQQNLVELRELEGQPVLLLFFPGAFTSVCTDELCSVSNDLSRYTDLNARVFGISTDSTAVLSEFRERNDIQFSLLSDHDAEVAAAYESKYDNNFTDMMLDRVAKRSAFVIDESGQISYAEVLENAGRQPDFEAVEKALR